MNKKYFLLITALLVLMGGVKVAAQVTDASNLTNAKAYTIKSAGRGYLYYNPSGSTTTLYSTYMVNAAPTTSEANNQFAFLRGLNTTSGQYYLYSVGAQKFVKFSDTKTEGNPVETVRGMVFSDTPTNDCKITLTAGTASGKSGFVIKYANLSGWQVNITDWNDYDSKGIKVFTNTDVDAGSVMVITEAATSYSGFAEAMKKIYDFEGINNIKTNCATKVGYPTTSTTAYTNFVSAYENGTLASSHLTALYNSTEVNKPVDGHAYTFTFKHMDGKRTYLYWNGNKITSAILNSGSTLPATAIFVCHQVGNKYMFVNPSSGNYLVWWGGADDGAYESNNGFTEAYASTKNLFEVNKITNGGNVQATNEELFGCVGLKGTRSTGDNPYFILKNTAGGAVASSAAYVDKTTTNANYRTCAVMIEEVEYYNKLKFQTPLTADGNDYASIFLPYAATVPAGATAYYGTLINENSRLHLTPIEGTTIHKNTAVVLVAPSTSNLGTVYVAPATEAGEEVNGNSLKGTVETTARNTAISTYVLNGGYGPIGFYKYTANNLPLGRAYFETANDVPSSNTGTNAKGYLFYFGNGETTGISNATMGNEAESTYYDLSGRRIAAPKHGLYIRNGKKVYIK